MRITKEVAQELIEALDESREKISKEAEEILKNMGQVYDFAKYERLREEVEERINNFPLYVKKAVKTITIAKTAGRPKKLNLVKRTHLFFLVRVLNKSNRDTKALQGSLLQPFSQPKEKGKRLPVRIQTDRFRDWTVRGGWILHEIRNGCFPQSYEDGKGLWHINRSHLFST